MTKCSSGKHLNAVRASENLIKLPSDQGYAIEFMNSLYVVKIGLSIDFRPVYGLFLCYV